MKAEADTDQPPSTSVPFPALTDWQITLEQLRAANEELQRRKADAEKDRDLFRDFYSKASAHATEVTKENNELLERVTIADGQVKDGLAMIRQTYEVRVKALEDEVARLQGLNAVLTARDAKMQGDDIRRRAAEEVDLRQENQRMRAQMAQLRMDYRKLERLVEQFGTRELEELEEQEPALQSRVEQAGVQPRPPIPIGTAVPAVDQTFALVGQ